MILLLICVWFHPFLLSAPDGNTGGQEKNQTTDVSKGKENPVPEASQEDKKEEFAISLNKIKHGMTKSQGVRMFAMLLPHVLQ